jgi:3-hydroxyisobutyrate dehydrogenase-like beta-hydroxyacid dehydrogenase
MASATKLNTLSPQDARQVAKEAEARGVNAFDGRESG